MEYKNMKKKQRENLEALLLALPCVLQTDDALSEHERAAGWRIFEKLLRTYIDKKSDKSDRRVR
jgi:hypothetical protein